MSRPTLTLFSLLLLTTACGDPDANPEHAPHALGDIECPSPDGALCCRPMNIQTCGEGKNLCSVYRSPVGIAELMICDSSPAPEGWTVRFRGCVDTSTGVVVEADEFYRTGEFAGQVERDGTIWRCLPGETWAYSRWPRGRTRTPGEIECWSEGESVAVEAEGEGCPAAW